MIFASFDSSWTREQEYITMGSPTYFSSVCRGPQNGKNRLLGSYTSFFAKIKISIWVHQKLPMQVLTAKSENSTNFTPICLFLAQTLKFSFLRSVSTNCFYCCLTIKIRSKSRKIKIPVNCVFGLFKVLNRYFELN